MKICRYYVRINRVTLELQNLFRRISQEVTDATSGGCFCGENGCVIDYAGDINGHCSIAMFTTMPGALEDTHISISLCVFECQRQYIMEKNET